MHLGPIAREISPEIALSFPNSFIGVTPQGWLREWDEEGIVSYCCWPDAVEVLKHAHVAVMSIEDVSGDEELVAEFAEILPILVVTEGADGSRVYWNGDVRTFRPPEEKEIDPVGAGDIFATSFFIRFHATKDPWESARFATLLAANSVTRKTIQGVPTPEEVRQFAAVVIDQKSMMTKIYTLVNQKGGVGKTTTAINLGAYLAQFGQRVLLVDLDPQANATSSLGINKYTVKNGTYDVLIGSLPISPAILHNPKLKISLLPSSPALAGAEVELIDMEEREYKLRQAIKPITDRFDYILD